MSIRRRPLIVGLVTVVVGALAALVAAQTPPTPKPVVTPKPLLRYAPLAYEVKLENWIAGFPRTTDPAITLRDLALVMPFAISGPTSRIDPKSMQPELWFDSRQDKGVSQRARLDANKHLGQTWAIIPIERFDGTVLRWNVKFRGQSWSTKVDENLMARVAWPREWPKDVADAMKPQLAIESDAPNVLALVKQALGENGRTMPPYHAAKEVIRNVVIAFRGVNTDTLERRSVGRTVGMRVIGAREAIANQQGSSHDLVCACVAALRAAGLPARPVIGITELSSLDARRANQDRTQMVSWGEFFLPDAGWVPFDPVELRDHAVRQLKVANPWPGVGAMPELNERMPVSWSFMPEGLPFPAFPALWSWQGLVGIDSNSLETYTSFTIIPRGKGVED